MDDLGVLLFLETSNYCQCWNTVKQVQQRSFFVASFRLFETHVLCIRTSSETKSAGLEYSSYSNKLMASTWRDMVNQSCYSKNAWKHLDSQIAEKIGSYLPPSLGCFGMMKSHSSEVQVWWHLSGSFEKTLERRRYKLCEFSRWKVFAQKNGEKSYTSWAAGITPEI